MRNLHLSPLALAVALTISGVALANDPPAKPEAAKPADAKADPKADPKAAKADAKKDDKPAEPELPSKPFPKVTAIPRPADKPAAKPAEKTAEKPADKPAEKAAEKPSEKPAEKAAANAHGGGHDKPVDMVIEKVPVVKHEAPKKRKPAPHAAAKHEPVKGALHDVARDAVDAHAHGQSAEVKNYVVEARDSLDSIIKKIFPTTPFSADVMREAFVKANPQVLADPKAKLRAGQNLRVPDQSMFRLVVLGDVSPPAAAKPHGDQPHAAPVEIIRPREPVTRDASTPAIAVAPAPTMNNPPNPDVIAIPKPPVIVAGSEGPVPPVSPEEKKKWVRFP